MLRQCTLHAFFFEPRDSTENVWYWPCTQHGHYISKLCFEGHPAKRIAVKRSEAAIEGGVFERQAHQMTELRTISLCRVDQSRLSCLQALFVFDAGIDVSKNIFLLSCSYCA